MTTTIAFKDDNKQKYATNSAEEETKEVAP
jgi:hypothetical protein